MEVVRRAGRRATVASLVATGALVLAACGGSDAAPPTTTALVTTSRASLSELDRTCEAAAALLYRNVEDGAADPDLAADPPAVTGLVPEQITAFLRDVAAQAEGRAADDIATAIAATKAFAEDQEPYDAEARAAFDRVVVWAAGPCPPSKPVWACIAPDSMAPPAGEPTASSPEAALGPPPAPRVGTRTTVLDEPDLAAYAWVDDHQLVRRRASVGLDVDGWRLLKVTSCPA